MKANNWSQLTLITILLSPVVCIFVRDLDDIPLGTKPTIKTRIFDDKLLDDIDDQLDADLIPPNFQPDPLLPVPLSADDFEDVGRLNKGRIGDDPEDPFNHYIDNVFGSFPDASIMFDALRSNSPSESLDRESSSVPLELLIPMLMQRELSADDEEDQDQQSDELQEATLQIAKLILDSKHLANKTDKPTDKDHERKLIGKLSPLKSSTTPPASKETTVKTTTDKPNESKEGIAIDEKADQSNGEEDEEKSKKSTTKPSKFRHFDNPLFRWWSKSKSAPKGEHKVHGKTTTDSGLTTKRTKPEVDEDDDDDLTSPNSTSTSTPSTKSSKANASTTIAPSTISTTNQGKGKASTTIKPNKSTTTSSTTSNSTKSDSEELVPTSKGKHSKATSRPSQNKKKEEDGDTDKVKMTEDPIDAFLSSLYVDLPTEKVNASTLSTNSSTTKSEAKNSHKHKTTTTPVPTLTTSIDTDKPTTIGSDSKPTTNEPEATMNATTVQSIDDDVFPTFTKSKSKSEATTSKPRSSLTIQGHGKTRHSSKTETSSKLTTTTIPTLRPYSEDPDDLLVPNWDPDLFP